VAVRSAIINVMVQAARKGARTLVHDFNEVEQLQVSQKGPADFVSEADRRAERTLRRELEKVRPDYGFLLEEGGEVAGRDATHRWIVDPLDGTTNFLHGIPHFAISIGLERSGEVVAGVVYDPLRDEMFWAERGAGAFLNDRRLRVSARRNMQEAIFATGIPFGERPGKAEMLAALPPMMERTAGVRRFGCASLDLAYVAAGRYEGFWEFGLSPWDVAAGIVVVREAGGFVTDLEGRPNALYADSIVAGNGQLHDGLRRMLVEAIAPARRGAAAG
jgi:myo-inositol-1(or 4)-monophosphatase